MGNLMQQGGRLEWLVFIPEAFMSRADCNLPPVSNLTNFFFSWSLQYFCFSSSFVGKRRVDSSSLKKAGQIHIGLSPGRMFPPEYSSGCGRVLANSPSGHAGTQWK